MFLDQTDFNSVANRSYWSQIFKVSCKSKLIVRAEGEPALLSQAKTNDPQNDVLSLSVGDIVYVDHNLLYKASKQTLIGLPSYLPTEQTTSQKTF